MSPTEDDLRAALHHGEGTPPNVNRIVAAGMMKRAQRRNIVTGVAAGILIIGGVTTGLTALGGSSSNGGGSSEKAASDRGAADNRPFPLPSSGRNNAGLGPSGAPAQASRAASGVACPSDFPGRDVTTPTPGSSGAGAALLDRPVASVVVCAYGSDLDIAQHATPARTELGTTDAAALRTSLNDAPTTRTGTTCLPARTTNLALYAVTADGTRLPVVVAAVGPGRCDGRVTNGTALRYGWTPPAGLRQQLDRLSPSASGSPPNHSPSGKNHGSPVR